MKNEKRKVKSGRFAEPEVLSEAEGTSHRTISRRRKSIVLRRFAQGPSFVRRALTMQQSAVSGTFSPERSRRN